MKNWVKEKLARGEKVTGTFFMTGNVRMMEGLGCADLDYVIIDTEHGPFTTETVMGLAMAAESRHMAPFVRIADVTHRDIQQALDAGAYGLIVPCLRTMEEMRRLVKLAKFPPEGCRGYAQGRHCGFGAQDWAKDLDEFIRVSNEELLVLPQCETLECLEQIEEVAALEGIDGIFVGPFDLSISLGIPGRFTDSRFEAAIDRILAACKAAGKPALIFTSDAAGAKKYLDRGFDGVATSTDIGIFMSGCQALARELRAAAQG